MVILGIFWRSFANHPEIGRIRLPASDPIGFGLGVGAPAVDPAPRFGEAGAPGRSWATGARDLSEMT